MFYRLAITLGLLALPLTTAHASYQQHYVFPSSSSSSEATSSSTTSSEAPLSTNPDGSSVDDENLTNVHHDMSAPMIEGLEDQDYVSGEWVILEDDTEKISRGLFTAELVRSIYTQGQIDGCFASISPSKSADFALVFTDVSVDHPYAKEICIAMRDGIVRGYTDGSFAPDRMVTFTESAKILSRAYALAPFADVDTKGLWYAGHVRALVVRNAVPISITKMSHIVTHGEATEMFDRLQNNVTWRPAQKEEVLFPPVIRRSNNVPSVSTSTSSTSSTSSSTPVIPPKRSRATSSKSSVAPASSEGSFWDLF